MLRLLNLLVHVSIANFYRINILRVYILILIIAWNSCSKDLEVIQSNADLPPSKCLVGTKVPIGISLVTPSRLVSNKDYLIIFENKNQETLEVFDLDSLRHLKSWNFEANASGSPQHIYQYSIALDEDNLSFAMNSTYNTLGINHGELSFIESRPLLPRYLDEQRDYFYLDSGIEMYHNVTLENEFQHLLIIDGKEKLFGRYPDTDQQFENIAEKEDFFITKTVSSSKHGRIMTFYQKMNLIRIYNYAGDLIKEIRCNLDEKTNGQVGFEEMYYYAEPYATETAIYCILVQRTLKSIYRDFDSFNPKLIAISWDGEILDTFEADIPFITLTVDTHRSKLYALDLKGVDYIISFDLPSIE